MKSANTQPVTRREQGADNRTARPENQIKFIRDIHARRDSHRSPALRFLWTRFCDNESIKECPR